MTTNRPLGEGRLDEAAALLRASVAELRSRTAGPEPSTSPPASAASTGEGQQPDAYEAQRQQGAPVSRMSSAAGHRVAFRHPGAKPASDEGGDAAETIFALKRTLEEIDRHGGDVGSRLARIRKLDDLLAGLSTRVAHLVTADVRELEQVWLGKIVDELERRQLSVLRAPAANAEQTQAALTTVLQALDAGGPELAALLRPKLDAGLVAHLQSGRDHVAEVLGNREYASADPALLGVLVARAVAAGQGPAVTVLWSFAQLDAAASVLDGLLLDQLFGSVAAAREAASRLLGFLPITGAAGQRRLFDNLESLGSRAGALLQHLPRATTLQAEVAEGLWRRLEDGSLSSRGRWLALQLLANLDAEALSGRLDVVVQALADPSPAVRCAAGELLARHPESTSEVEGAALLAAALRERQAQAHLLACTETVADRLGDLGQDARRDLLQASADRKPNIAVPARRILERVDHGRLPAGA